MFKAAQATCNHPAFILHPSCNDPGFEKYSCQVISPFGMYFWRRRRLPAATSVLGFPASKLSTDLQFVSPV
jgi:hypothetical protein